MDQKLDVRKAIRELGVNARAAARLLARAETAAKHKALTATAAAIRASEKKILEANKSDVAEAKKAGRDAAFVDRLTLTPESIEHMADGVEQVVALADPVGE